MSDALTAGSGVAVAHRWTPSLAADPAECLAGGGQMGALMRSTDWSRTPLGPVDGWPQSLRTAVSICLGTSFPMMISWGPELIMLYNDGFRPVLGTQKHPRALGQPLLECFAEIRDIIDPMFRGVLASGEAVGAKDMMFPLERNGYTEETYFLFSYSPIRDESGGVAGVLTTCAETTERVIGERRLKTLRALAEGAAQARTAEEALGEAARTLNPADVPFGLFYLVEGEGAAARLIASSGIREGGPAAPVLVDVTATAAAVWPLREALERRRPVLAEHLPAGVGPLPGGPWPEQATGALVLPLARPGQPHPYGVVVAGLSPRRALDDDYRAYLDLVADHVATAVANARAREEERRRAEALAEIDRAKTAFFSNVSHEFRTPLTLMIGPLEDALAGAHGDPPPALRDALALAHRNSLRLLKLVNSLLDFARIEAGRMQAVYEPVDLAAITAELAGSFRCAAERAGLRLEVECQPIVGQVHVDQEMWEKIVLNLLSNALKFTFEGEIRLSLRGEGARVVLEVRDTGTGIPAEELPNVFKRFHRIEGARARTHEGSGIGLALVHELVRLHGGEIACQSEVDRGTTFTVSIPTGTAHLSPDRIGARRQQASTAIRTEAFVEEARRWISGEPVPADPRRAPDPVPHAGAAHTRATAGARVLVADDNADMRYYLQRILGQHWVVEAAADGASALAAAERDPPDLVLADVMMPGLDGFALLDRLRASERTRHVPVVMVSARAGEEARIEGLDAGADDYVTKPFSARELVARVNSQLTLSRARRAMAEQRAVLYELFRQVPASICVVCGPDLVFEMVNDRFVKMCGIEAKEVLGRPALDAFPALRGRGVEEVVRAVMRTGTSRAATEVPLRYDLDGDGVAEDTWWNYICAPLPDERGEVDRVMTFSYEVTDQVVARRKVEASAAELGKLVAIRDETLARLEAAELERTALLERERVARREADLQREHLHALFMQAPTPICILRGPRHVIELANLLACEVWGRNPQDVIGRPVLEALPELEGQVFPSLLDGVLATGEPCVGKEIPGELGPPGARKTRYFNFVFAPLRSLGGEAEGVLVVAFDVSDELRARDELSRTVRYNEMFAGILGHDLRNPLAAIMNAGQLIEQRTREGDTAATARRILSSGRRMARMIDQLLDFTRIRLGGGIAIHLERVDLAEVAARVVAEVETAAAARRFRIETAGDATGTWDADRLAQVVSNLAANAVQHGTPGAPLSLRIDGREPDVVTATFENGGVIPGEILPVVFDPFRGTRGRKTNSNGLGLGLFISREIAHAHGGRLQVLSDAEHGTLFTLRLPRVASPPPEHSRQQA